MGRLLNEALVILDKMIYDNNFRRAEKNQINRQEKRKLMNIVTINLREKRKNLQRKNL